MSQKRLLPEKERNERADRKGKKDKHKDKIFADLNNAGKFEIIEDDLRSRGVIE